MYFPFGALIALLRGKIVVLTKIFFQTIELWTRKFVTTCGVAVPTTVYERVVPTTTTEGVRPREMGRYRKSYELGGQARVIRMPLGGLAE
jgi:hypothetical protein